MGLIYRPAFDPVFPHGILVHGHQQLSRLVELGFLTYVSHSGMPHATGQFSLTVVGGRWMLDFVGDAGKPLGWELYRHSRHNLTFAFARKDRAMLFKTVWG